jgi:hypothetical protein
LVVLLGVEGDVGLGESKLPQPFPEGLHDLSMIGGGGSRRLRKADSEYVAGAAEAADVPFLKIKNFRARSLGLGAIGRDSCGDCGRRSSRFGGDAETRLPVAAQGLQADDYRQDPHCLAFARL